MGKNVLEFECIGMKNGGKFPVENTGRGKDISPEFIIKNLSPHARSFIITLEDLSHPIKKFTHWIIWNIPAADKIASAIPSGKTISSPEGAVQGIAYGLHRYAGPKPPKGKSCICQVWDKKFFSIFYSTISFHKCLMLILIIFSCLK